jgi:hypothetical protein
VSFFLYLILKGQPKEQICSNNVKSVMERSNVLDATRHKVSVVHKQTAAQVALLSGSTRHGIFMLGACVHSWTLLCFQIVYCNSWAISQCVSWQGSFKQDNSAQTSVKIWRNRDCLWQETYSSADGFDKWCNTRFSWNTTQIALEIFKKIVTRMWNIKDKLPPSNWTVKITAVWIPISASAPRAW